MALKITAVSHLDHGLTGRQLAWVLKKYVEKSTFFIETVTLPDGLGPQLHCALRGPIMGDDPIMDNSSVIYKPRSDRAWNTRFTSLPQLRTDQLTVIAGPHEDDSCVLFTCYGGPLAPKEPGDPTLKPEERAGSEEFWKVHALSCY